MTASGRASELPERGRGIGSSDIAAISGLNPWRKPIDVWLEKTGRAESGPATDAMQAGQRIEPVLAEWYADRVGLRRDQLRSSETLRDSDEAWILATPDRIVATEPEKLLEIKVVGSRLVDHWREGIPDYVLAQVQWQMQVSGIPSADIAALLGGSELRILACPYFEELAQELVEMGRAFWFEHVQKDLPPRVDGSESWRRYLRARWPAEKRSIERAPPEAEVLVEGLFAAKELFERTRERKVAAENALKLLIGDAAGPARIDLGRRPGRPLGPAPRTGRRWPSSAAPRRDHSLLQPRTRALPPGKRRMRGPVTSREVAGPLILRSEASQFLRSESLAPRVSRGASAKTDRLTNLRRAEVLCARRQASF